MKEKKYLIEFTKGDKEDNWGWTVQCKNKDLKGAISEGIDWVHAAKRIKEAIELVEDSRVDNPKLKKLLRESVVLK